MDKEKIYFALAMTEVQNDCAYTEADICDTLESAKSGAMAFLMSRVGDFLDIDDGEVTATPAREAAVKKHLKTKESSYCKLKKFEYEYRIEGLCVSVTVQECKVKEGDDSIVRCEIVDRVVSVNEVISMFESQSGTKISGIRKRGYRDQCLDFSFVDKKDWDEFAGPNGYSPCWNFDNGSLDFVKFTKQSDYSVGSMYKKAHPEVIDVLGVSGNTYRDEFIVKCRIKHG